MGINELKKNWKIEAVDIFISLIVTAGIYYYINYIGEVGKWFLPVMFMIILIYLKNSK